MTVCIATDNNIGANTGIGTFNLHLSSLLLHAGHTVILLCTEETSTVEPDQVIQKGNLTTVIFKRTYTKEKEKHTGYYSPGSFDAPRWIAMGEVYSAWLSKNAGNYEIDIVEASDFGGIGIFLCRKNLPPLIITFHGPLSQMCKYNFCPRDDHYSTIKKLEELSFQHAQAVITHSDVSLSTARQLTSKPVYKTLIPWQQTEAGKSEDNNDYGLVVGGLQMIKGAQLLCKSLEGTSGHGSKPIIHWIGEDSFSSPRYTSVADYLQEKYPAVWNKQIIWRGLMDHQAVLNEIGRAAFIAIPSLWETFNYVALEAANSRKAIIITDKTGAAELFHHGNNALIVPAQNEEAFANAIIELSTNVSTREMLAENAQKVVTSIFERESIEQRIEFYNNVKTSFGGHEKETGDSLSFLNKYHSRSRRFYFQSKNILKKVIGHK